MDETGALVNLYAYDPWGRLVAATETVENPFLYASYYYDSDTGLYYLLHRYYDPQTRRFLTVDWASPSIARPASANLYVYCEDNPTNRTDPLGHNFLGILETLSELVDAFEFGWDIGRLDDKGLTPEERAARALDILIDGYTTWNGLPGWAIDIIIKKEWPNSWEDLWEYFH